MEREKIQVKGEKEIYEKPSLTKHGKLKEITSYAGSLKQIELTD